MEHYAMKDIDRDSSPLHDWANNSGMGFSNEYRFDTSEGVRFMISQYERFGLPLPPHEMLNEVFMDVFRIMDCFDPYVWFELTDVTVTDEWRCNTFEIIHMDGKIEEASPEDFDHFRLIPGKERENFDDMYNNPGLQHSCFLYIDHYIEELTEEECQTDEFMERHFGQETVAWLNARVAPDVAVPEFDQGLFRAVKSVAETDDDDVVIGTKLQDIFLSYQHLSDTLKGKELDRISPIHNILSPEIRPIAEALVHNWKQRETKLDYIRLSIWASFVWMISPMARDFRRDKYDIFDAAYTEGECMFHMGSTIPRKNYRITARSPQSCMECGINGWCICQANILGVNRHLCEFHVNGDLPKIAPLNCGTLFCKAVECIHHPYKGMKDAKLIVHREGGAITHKMTARRAELSVEWRPTGGFLN